MFFPPQGHLLSCAVHCLLWLQKTQQSANSNDDDSDDEEEDEGYQSELHAIFESMTGRMLKSELEDFELVTHYDRQINSRTVMVYLSCYLPIMIAVRPQSQ